MEVKIFIYMKMVCTNFKKFFDSGKIVPFFVNFALLGFPPSSKSFPSISCSGFYVFIFEVSTKTEQCKGLFDISHARVTNSQTMKYLNSIIEMMVSFKSKRVAAIISKEK